MTTRLTETFAHLLRRSRGESPIRIAVVGAAQESILETVREAAGLGIAEFLLVGGPGDIEAVATHSGFALDRNAIVEAGSEEESARRGAELVREGRADALMKGHLHTDTFMHALLDADYGLRLPGRRVSHVFVVDVPALPRLLAITDAAINIAPDLNAKAEILRNAVELMQLVGVERPKVAVLSAIETINPALASTLDAACLTLMARRGQIAGAEVDGPLAFDNALSARAAREKGIDSPVAGRADILLVPGLVSGNVLAKNFEYHANAVAAGMVSGLAVPVVLSSRADPPISRLAGLALAGMMYRSGVRLPGDAAQPSETSLGCAPQSEAACCPPTFDRRAAGRSDRSAIRVRNGATA